jgi:hypothetical protein
LQFICDENRILNGSVGSREFFPITTKARAMKDNEIEDDKNPSGQGKSKRTFKSGDSESDLDQITQWPKFSIHEIFSE